MQQENIAVGPPARQLAEVIPLPGARVARPLRICLLGYRSHPYSGGQGIYLKYLSKALVEAGHQVDVISGQPYPQLDPRVRLVKMPGLNLYETGLRSLRPRHLLSWANNLEWLSKLTGGFAEPQAFGQRVVSYLRKFGRDYDIIHDNQSLSFGMLTLQREGFPLVTTIHHPTNHDLELALSALPRWRLIRRFLVWRWHTFVYMQTWVVRRLRHVVTVSESSRRDISRAYRISPAQVSLVHCGIDIREFSPRLGISRSPNRLMATASADQPLKGLRYLLLAYSRLLPEFPDLELLVVGKPKPGGDTEKLLQQLGLEGKVRFVNGISTEQLVDYYAEATVAVVPSLYEGFGLPAGEAMACGVPLVSTRAGALPEVVGDAGVLVPQGDSTALFEVLRALLLDPARREQLGRAGRKRIEETFCWQIAAREMTDFYSGVLAESDGNG